jgi:hypothetical protein
MRTQERRIEKLLEQQCREDVRTQALPKHLQGRIVPTFSEPYGKKVINIPSLELPQKKCKNLQSNLGVKLNDDCESWRSPICRLDQNSKEGYEKVRDFLYFLSASPNS